ncbi:GspH/FimT family pseudopilin [Dyella sp. 2HG41-7]|uniref:GspH/FimT family pseudopilin n=1 Tax=Dyella sp. 2HG41-7 TaxID=2883239 RepID=UPI001F158F2B|nr:GspH/FimT family pseudopilin [Dyella sp. 2HG41-7]
MSQRRGPARPVDGFTTVELMITVAVAAVLFVIAIPSFNNIINTNRLTTVANELVGSLNAARMEAIKRNADTQFCSDLATNNTTGTTDALGNACTTASGAVFVLTNTVTGATSQVMATPSDLATPVVLHGDIVAVRFHGDGLAYLPSTPTTIYDSSTANVPLADICVAALKSNNHVQIWMATGSIITTTSTTGTCP